MKKITDILKPNILIVFGALFFLVYLNYLSYSDEALALGIIAVIFASYYIAIGILGIILGDKFSPMLKKVFDVVSACLFPIFMFIYFLMMTINIADYMGPTAWIIAILSLVASLAAPAFFAVSKFINKPLFVRIAFLSVAIFALALLLNVLFDASGATTVLGNISIVGVVLYALFIIYLFNALNKAEETPKQEAPKQEEASNKISLSKEEPAPEQGE